MNSPIINVRGAPPKGTAVIVSSTITAENEAGTPSLVDSTKGPTRAKTIPVGPMRIAPGPYNRGEILSVAEISEEDLVEMVTSPPDPFPGGKFDQPAWAPGRFKTFERCKETLIGRDLLSLDFDHGGSFDDVVARFKETGLRAWIHTTYNHPDPDGSARLRVYVRLSREVDAEEWDRAIKPWMEKFGAIDENARDVVRYAFLPVKLPEYRYAVLPGETLDVEALLAGAPAITPKTATRGPVSELGAFAEELPPYLEELADRLAAACAKAEPEQGNRHALALHLAGAACSERSGVSLEHVPALVYEVCRRARFGKLDVKRSAAEDTVRKAKNPERASGQAITGFPRLRERWPDVANAFENPRGEAVIERMRSGPEPQIPLAKKERLFRDHLATLEEGEEDEACRYAALERLPPENAADLILGSKTLGTKQTRDALIAMVNDPPVRTRIANENFGVAFREAEAEQQEKAAIKAKCEKAKERSAQARRDLSAAQWEIENQPIGERLGLPEDAPICLGRGDHAELSDVVGARFPNALFAEGSWYEYDSERGVWTLDDAEKGMRDYVCDLANAFTPVGPPNQKTGIQKYWKMHARDVNGILEILENKRKKKDYFVAPQGLACRNGFVTIKDNEPTVTPHDPDHRARAFFDLDFDKDAKAPRFEAFLSSLFKDEPDAEQKKDCILEFFGGALFGLSTRGQKCIVAPGGGSNGKSTLIDIITVLFPEGSISALAPQAWADPVRLTALSGKLLNVCAELPKKGIDESEVFKGVITGDRVTANPKHKDEFAFRPVAGHFFAANALPATTDQTNGFWRRFIVIKFDKSFEGVAANTSIKDKILAEERAGVLAALVRGAARLQKRLAGNLGYTIPASHADEMAQWRRDSDTVALFIDEETIPATGTDRLSATLMYAQYKLWAVDNGYRPVASNKFGERAKAQKRGSVRSEAGNVYPLKRKVVPKTP